MRIRLQYPSYSCLYYLFEITSRNSFTLPYDIINRGFKNSIVLVKKIGLNE